MKHPLFILNIQENDSQQAAKTPGQNHTLVYTQIPQAAAGIQLIDSVSPVHWRTWITIREHVRCALHRL